MNARMLYSIAGALALMAPVAAQAGNPEGRIQIKLLGSAVLADGKLSTVRTDLIGLPAGTGTKADDNVVPTLAVEYFLTPSISAETICRVTCHGKSAARPMWSRRGCGALTCIKSTMG